MSKMQEPTMGITYALGLAQTAYRAQTVSGREIWKDLADEKSVRMLGFMVWLQRICCLDADGAARWLCGVSTTFVVDNSK